jgi:hypothetical protein
MLQKIQPIALRGWREEMMAPITEKVNIVARVKTALPGSASLPYRNSGSIELAMRDNEIPPKSSATDSIARDQANLAAKRGLILPTP